MSPLMKIKNLLSINNVSETIKRFSLPTLCLSASTIILISLIFRENITSITFEIRILLFLVIAFLGLTAINLYAESHQLKKKLYLLSLVVFLTALACLTFSKNIAIYNLLLLEYGLFFAITIAPFLRRKVDNITYCNFSCTLTHSMFFATVSSLILIAGTSAIFASVSYLFAIKIGYKIYLSTFVIYYFFFTPLYVLGGVPKNFFSTEETHYPKDVKFISTFILSPLVFVYLIILYTYIIKISLQHELPKGILATMISGFGFAGIVTHFLIYPIAQNSNKFIKLFSRYFYHSLLIPTAFLFYAAMLRINEYGITEERYLLILIATWLGASSLYIALSKAKNLKVVTITLSALLILSSFGPWSASAVSEFSQVRQLEKLLEPEGILVNGEIKKSNHKIAADKTAKISNIVHYLASTKKISKIKKWFPQNSYLGNEADNSIKIDHNKIMNDMGLTYVTSSPYKTAQKSISLSMKDQPSLYNQIFDVSGFDYAMDFHFYANSATSALTIKTQDGLAAFTASIKEKNLIITNNATVTIAVDLEKFINDVQNSKQEGKDFIINLKNENFNAKLYIKYISANYPNNQLEINNIQCLLLVKILKK